MKPPNLYPALMMAEVNGLETRLEQRGRSKLDIQATACRLGQNSLQEKLTKLWIDRSLRKLGLRQPAGRRSKYGAVAQISTTV